MRTEPLQHDLRRALQEPDERAHDDEERAHRRGDDQRRAFGVAKCDPLRHELADHHVQERQDEVREEHGEHGRQEVVEEMRERLLAEGTDTERSQRDSELHGRDEARRIGRDS